MNQKRISFKIASWLIAALIVSASVSLASTDEKSSKGTKYTVVKTVKIIPQKLEINDTYIGHLKPVERVIVSADTEGPVERINFREGQQVKMNQVLVHIATERLAIRKKIAASNYYSSITSYQKEKSLLEQNFQDQHLEVQVQQAVSSYQLAQTNYQKELKMFQKNISTETRVDASKNALDTAKANLNMAKLSLAKSRAISNKSKLNDLMNQMQINKYQLDLAKLDLLRSQVKSPFSGIVSKKKIEKGGFINKGQELLEIMDISKVLAQIKIPENKIRLIKIGSKVSVGFDALPGKTFTGFVKTLGLEADTGSRTFPAEIQINNQKQELLPGMMARVNIELKSSDKQVLIPRHVILNRNNGKIVFVDEKGTAKKRFITLGKTIKGQVQILKGLNFGDRLIISGQQYLSHNDKINAKVVTQNKLARR